MRGSTSSNDGEYGKSGWSLYFLDRVTGFEIRKLELQPVAWLGRDLERFPDFFAQEMPDALRGQPIEACVGPISYRGGPSSRADVDNLRQGGRGAQPREIFMTSVAPASAAYNGVNEYYASERDYVFAIAEALREEYRAVHRAGFIPAGRRRAAREHVRHARSAEPAAVSRNGRSCGSPR